MPSFGVNSFKNYANFAAQFLYSMKALKVILIVFAVLIAGSAFWFYRSLNTPVQHNKTNEYIQIPKGSSAGQIISKLASEGIISSATATKIYLKTLGKAINMQAGEYQFASPISALQVLDELKKGKDRTVRLVIPEGFTRFDIADRIAARFPQNPSINKDSILELMDNTSLIKDINPEAKNLEGYMYPSTYDFPVSMSAEAIIEKMVAQFRKVWKPEYTEQGRKLGRTPHEILTIASLIETESRYDQERPIVASVIYNRLKRGMALGIDQTAVYIAKMENRWDGIIHRSDLQSNSPYNTRKFAGLPPGPISSVSENSIKAALNPASTNYIYYVLNVEKNDKSHHFYATAAEFERGKAAYQAWLKKQR